MLMLTLDLLLGPGQNQLPAHLGGVLHGFVEGGVKNHAPHHLPVLRPNGPNEAAHFSILPPPFGEPIGDHLRFAIMLYGTVAEAWPVVLRALLEQQGSNLNGRRVSISQAWCGNPDGEAFSLLEQGQLLEWPDDFPMVRNVEAMALRAQENRRHSAFHHLSFRSPLLLASRSAQRDRSRLAAGLPWPSLASILKSIAKRMRALEPELAHVLGLRPDWTAVELAHACEPLTPAATPARQIEWEYRGNSRHTGQPHIESHLGIVGDLIYPATGIEHERQLLYWGQWLGVGQKTTMGCGSYVLMYR